MADMLKSLIRHFENMSDHQRELAIQRWQDATCACLPLSSDEYKILAREHEAKAIAFQVAADYIANFTAMLTGEDGA